jgi:hypothetical protein
MTAAGSVLDSVGVSSRCDRAIQDAEYRVRIILSICDVAASKQVTPKGVQPVFGMVVLSRGDSYGVHAFSSTD